jgi:hypothetical protein
MQHVLGDGGDLLRRLLKLPQSGVPFMNHRPIVFILAALLFTGCASTSTYDLPKTQAQLSTTLQTTESIVQKAQRDFQEKKLLLDNLNKAGSANYRENESDLNGRLKRMEQSLAEITAGRKEMVDAKSDLASLGYNRTQVGSADKEYPLVEEAVARFEKAAGRTNSALLDYSRESNSLADTVANKKLFFNFDVAEFQKRVQKNIQISSENQRVMLKELNRAENVLNNWNKPEGKEAQEQVFDQMHSIAKEYSLKAGRFAELSKSVHAATMGNARVSTLDKEWPEVQKLVGEFEQTSLELSSLNEKFQTQVNLFRNPAKRVQ